MAAILEQRAKLPLVTVVVISYNHGPYLHECLTSIAEQSYAHIHCIVVDNASGDGSRAVIEAFGAELKQAGAATTFEPIFSADNTHLTGAMIQGFARARGSYVIFIDGDDFMLPDCVAAHITAHLVTRVPVGFTSVDMFQSRGADLVVGTGLTFARFIMSGLGQRRPFCRMENLAAFDLPPGGARIKESELHLVERSMTREWVWSPTSGLCFRREAVQLMFNRRPDIRAGTDNYLARGISSLTGSITIDRPLAVYRLHESNMFAKHPALTNLVSFDKTQSAASDLEVSLEIIECFRVQAAELAARLEFPDSYIEAIDYVSRVGCGIAFESTASSYALHFLTANRDRLERAFGAPTYRRWRRRYKRLSDYVPSAGRALLGLTARRRAPASAARHDHAEQAERRYAETPAPGQ